MSFSITILGSGGAMPAYGRSPSAQLIKIQNTHVLVDCGEGTQMKLMQYDCNLHRIDHIFISHLHGDHYLGLMGLLFTMHLQRRVNDIHIYSHGGLDEIITAHFRYSQSALRFKIIFHRIEEGVIETVYEDKTLTIQTIPLVHKIRCSGFLFKEKPKPRRIDKDKLPANLPLLQLANLKNGGDVTDENGGVLYRNEDLTLPPRRSRSYAYCADTAFHENMIDQIRGVDLLYHEATFTEEDVARATETLHSTAKQAALIARKAGVKKLLLGHFSARYKDLQPLREEAEKEFTSLALALEGEIFTIDDK